MMYSCMFEWKVRQKNQSVGVDIQSSLCSVHYPGFLGFLLLIAPVLLTNFCLQRLV